MISDMMQGQMGNNASIFNSICDFFANSIIGGWFGCVFDDYLILRIPFPIPTNFREMFQKGIQLDELNPSWISSLSWYFIIAIGIKSLMSQLLRKKEVDDADKTMQDQFQESFNVINQNVQNRRIFRAASSDRTRGSDGRCWRLSPF